MSRPTALGGIDLRPKREDIPPERAAAERPDSLGAAPREPIFICQGCGAVGNEKGKPLDSTCKCKGDSTFEQLALADNVGVIDPETEMPNEYAKRIKFRHAADTAYLILQEARGHMVAATAVCSAFGHDPMAGMCLRCGARVGYDFERD